MESPRLCDRISMELSIFLLKGQQVEISNIMTHFRLEDLFCLYL